MICDEELSLFDLNNNDTVAFLETIINISNVYGLFHKYICFFICTFGSIANVIHIFVLTRPIMQKCAVNRLLSIIAVCDIFTMLSYLIFVIRFGFAVNLTNPPPGYALKWIIFLLTHVVGSIVLHSITLYLSCATAYIRYKTLKKVGSRWNHENAAGPIFLVVTMFVIFFCIPTFLIHSIVKVVVPSTEEPNVNETLYTVGLADFTVFSTCFVFKLNLWLTGIMFKVIPCILLMLFTVALLWELELNRRRRKLITSGTTAASRKSIAHSDRTTKVLIILLLIFLFTEFPQGILAILNGIFPNDVHQFVYLSLGELLDLLSLINCNTCFIVYLLISTQYRETLKSFIRRLQYKLYYCKYTHSFMPEKMHDASFFLSRTISDINCNTPSCRQCTRYNSSKDLIKKNSKVSQSQLLSPNTYPYNLNNSSQYCTSVSVSPVQSSTPKLTLSLSPLPDSLLNNCATHLPKIDSNDKLLKKTESDINMSSHENFKTTTDVVKNILKKQESNEFIIGELQDELFNIETKDYNILPSNNLINSSKENVINILNIHMPSKKLSDSNLLTQKQLSQENFGNKFKTKDLKQVTSTKKYSTNIVNNQNTLDFSDELDVLL